MVTEKLVEVHPFIYISDQHLAYNIFHALGSLYIFIKNECLIFNDFYQIHSMEGFFGQIKGDFTKNHLVNDHPQAPYVTFFGVLFVF
jgi:hypothetical protein